MSQVFCAFEGVRTQVTGRPVIQIYCFPKRIIAGIKSSPIDVELIRENQLPRRPVTEGIDRIGIIGSILINETKVSDIGDLEFVYTSSLLGENGEGE